MADNLCGPSNGAKSLLTHVDRDRSLYQDRVNGVSPSTGGASSFRTQPAAANAAIANAEFAAFQHAALAPVTGPGVGLPGQNGGVQGALAGPSFNSHGFAAPAFMAPNGPVASSPANFDPRAAHVSPVMAHNNSWVDQFAHMNLNQAPQMPSATSTVTPVPPSSFQSSYSAPRMLGTYMPYQFPAQTPALASDPMAQVGSGNAAEDAAFSQAFDAYDDGFQVSLDEWMAENGPTADAMIDRNMERIANDQELWERIGDPSLAPIDQNTLDSQAARLEEENAAMKKRAEQEELADAAESILSAVAGNTSERFQNSRFLQIMRRIANYEVVAENNDLVDAGTGESVVTGRTEDDGNGKGKEVDAGEVQGSTQ